MKKGKDGIYNRYIKRILDFLIAFAALIVLLPLLLFLTVVGAIAMKGNPFFCQNRPGKKGKDDEEKIFKLIKFRTMTNEKDKDGNLLPAKDRLTSYGRFLRKSSLDELPQLFCILAGRLSFCGPRPLLVKYIPLYSEEQRHRHDIRPGLTGYAQVHGRNSISWEDKFDMDVWYTKNVSLKTDLKIIIDTFITVVKREGISSSNSEIVKEFTGTKQGNDSTLEALV